MQEIVKNFTLIHIDAPGQEEGTAAYPAGYDIYCMTSSVSCSSLEVNFSEMETIFCAGLKPNLYQKYFPSPTSPSSPVSNTLLSEV